MLIEFQGDKPLTVDGNAMFKNIRINIASNHQLRAKMIYIDNGSEVPVDIVIYKYGRIKCSLSRGIEFNIDGEEYTRHIQFRIWISYDIIKNVWLLRGTVGDRNINLAVDKSSLNMVISLIKEIIK